MGNLNVTTPHAFNVRAVLVNPVTITPGAPVVVLVPTPGVPGPRGPAGDGGFTHTQTSPAATWTITNTLGRYPSAVTVVVGDEIVDADIELPDINTIVVIFATPQSGQVEVI